MPTIAVIAVIAAIATTAMPSPGIRSRAAPVTSADANIAAAAMNASGTASFGRSSAGASTPRRYDHSRAVLESVRFFART